tara:strand:+ start:34 stop:207 length:174 start_codon:yes stop_codon:yes gene_type:complete
LVIITFIINGFSLLEISGYIDPGSLSAIMAAIIGGIVGTGMTLKLYWYKIKQRISRD